MSDLYIASDKDYIIDNAKKTSSSVSDIKCLQTHSLRQLNNNHNYMN